MVERRIMIEMTLTKKKSTSSMLKNHSLAWYSYKDSRKLSVSALAKRLESIQWLSLAQYQVSKHMRASAGKSGTRLSKISKPKLN